MKKIIAGILVAAFMAATVCPPQAQAANDESGGVKGFLTGCCFGMRVAADYNEKGIGERDFVPWFFVGFCLGTRAQSDYADGKSTQLREWGRILPYVGVVFAIWDGVDGANGVTRSDYAEKYGSTYY